MSEETRELISRLKAQRNAVILAHNYQPPEIQDIADFLGDSLELSRKAAKTDAEVIVFCGVSFMAETAAILNPEKTVILAHPGAGCPMADMITAEDVRGIRREHPGVPVVTYVNSSAAVKAESTICCTSANVVKVVNSFTENDTLYLAPDRNLALFAARHTDKKILYWHGYCPIHNAVTAEAIRAVKAEHPGVPLLVHPECPPEVLELAEVVQSTSGMLRYVTENPGKSFIIGTEQGILYTMRKLNPGKEFIPAAPGMVCADMKSTSLADIVRSLETLGPRVTVPEEIRVKALSAVERMIAIG